MVLTRVGAVLLLSVWYFMKLSLVLVCDGVVVLELRVCGTLLLFGL